MWGNISQGIIFSYTRRSPVYSSDTELTPKRVSRYISEWGCGRTRDRGTCLSRCTWTWAHPPISAADAPRAFNPLSFEGGGEASVRLSHRRVSFGCVRAKLHRRFSRVATRYESSLAASRSENDRIYINSRVQKFLLNRTERHINLVASWCIRLSSLVVAIALPIRAMTREWQSTDLSDVISKKLPDSRSLIRELSESRSIATQRGLPFARIIDSYGGT